MDTKKWQPRFEIGIEQIDSEHKKLMYLIDACIESSRSGATHQELVVRLNEVREYVASHFRSEENLSVSAGKPLSGDHRAQHKYLLDFMQSEIHDFMESRVSLVDRSNRKVSAQGILVYLYDWYISHLESEDKKLVGSEL